MQLGLTNEWATWRSSARVVPAVAGGPLLDWELFDDDLSGRRTHSLLAYTTPSGPIPLRNRSRVTARQPRWLRASARAVSGLRHVPRDRRVRAREDLGHIRQRVLAGDLLGLRRMAERVRGDAGVRERGGDLLHGTPLMAPNA